MQMIDIRNQIISVLVKHGYFILSSHSKLIEIEQELGKFKNSIIVQSFRKLEELNVVTKVSENMGDTAWVPEGTYQSKTQELTVSNSTAEYLANAINFYRKEKGIKDGACDKLSIKDSDIQSLILIYEQTLAAKNTVGNN